VVKYLFDRWPEAIKEKNGKGELPLHLVARRSGSLDL
jgi:hypothetical protein